MADLVVACGSSGVGGFRDGDRVQDVTGVTGTVRAIPVAEVYEGLVDALGLFESDALWVVAWDAGDDEVLNDRLARFIHPMPAGDARVGGAR